MNVCLPMLALCLVYLENDNVIKNASYCQIILSNMIGQRSSFLVWRNPDSIHYHTADLKMIFYSKNIKEALDKNRVSVAYYDVHNKEVVFDAYEDFNEYVERMIARQLDQTALLPESFSTWFRGECRTKAIEEEGWCNLF